MLGLSQEAGVFNLIEFIGIVFGAWMLVRFVGKLAANSFSLRVPNAPNQLTLGALWLLYRYELKTDPVIVAIFMFSSAFLVSKYSGMMTMPEENDFFELITLFCIIHFALDFRLHPLQSEQEK